MRSIDEFDVVHHQQLSKSTSWPCVSGNPAVRPSQILYFSAALSKVYGISYVWPCLPFIRVPLGVISTQYQPRAASNASKKVH